MVSPCLMLSLTACRTEIVREPVLPPPAFYAECPINYADRTIGAALEALSGAIDCERANNKALAEWVASYSN